MTFTHSLDLASNVIMSITPNGTLYDSTYADIMCSVAVGKNIDTPVTIVWEWFTTYRLDNGTDYNIAGDTLRINRINLL